MGKYTDSNWKVLERALKTSNAEPSKEFILEVRNLSDEIMDYVARSGATSFLGANGIPIWTGNLMDSIGIGIYRNGALIYMGTNPEQADQPQTHKGETYYGRNKLQDAFNMSSDIGSGLVLRIFSASPISELINTEGSPRDRGIGFFDDITKFATDAVERRFNR